MTQGLIQSLSLVLTNVANDYKNFQLATEKVSVETITKPDNLGQPKHLIFVGGFLDSEAFHNMDTLAGQYKSADTTSEYYSWWNISGIRSEIQKWGGDVTLIGHSYGGDTAATIVASGMHVKNLMTIDPVF